jgi:hypothetical protein
MYGQTDIYGATQAGAGFGQPGLDCPIPRGTSFGSLEAEIDADFASFGDLDAGGDAYGAFEKARIKGKIEKIYRVAGKIQYLVDIGKVDSARKKAKKLAKVFSKLEGIKGADEFITDALKDTVAAMDAFADGRISNPHDYVETGAATPGLAVGTGWLTSGIRDASLAISATGTPAATTYPAAYAVPYPVPRPFPGRRPPMHRPPPPLFRPGPGVGRPYTGPTVMRPTGGPARGRFGAIDPDEAIAQGVREAFGVTARLDAGDFTVPGLAAEIGGTDTLLRQDIASEAFGAFWQRSTEKHIAALQRRYKEARRIGNIDEMEKLLGEIEGLESISATVEQFPDIGTTE